MSDQDIFNTENNEPVAPSPNTDVLADKLSRITGEDGRPKYDSVDKALDALAHSQEHIRRLEQEAKDRGSYTQHLEDQVKRVNTLEELVTRMTTTQSTNSEPARPAATEGLSEQHIIQLVQQALNNDKQTSAAINNVKSVQDKLVEKFGEANAVEVIKTKCRELGTTPEKLKALSAENPNLVLALFGSTSINNETPLTSTVRSPGLNPQSEGLKAPEQSLISGPGANDRALRDFFSKVKQEVYKQYDVNI